MSTITRCVWPHNFARLWLPSPFAADGVVLTAHFRQSMHRLGSAQLLGPIYALVLGGSLGQVRFQSVTI